jgi:site-specific DNA-methyltransferase (adenine-specific)
MKLDALHNRDCIAGMSRLAQGSVDLAFADPPFNIGYTYDVYEDRRAADEYLAWTKKWGQALVRTLKPTGTAWLAIGDDFAAELKMIFQRELGLYCRSWVIWYYTFGVNCSKKFSRSHTHLFHFVKDPKDFTFNTDAIRVPSARQLVYADTRANSKGRLPDDTWILRPQDAAGSFTPEENVWYFPRVCGTFKERAGWHGCQMPEQLLGRIIKSCSNPGETVLDPFGGSGTTLAVAKKLERRFIGFELSENYAKQIQARLKATQPGDPLSGAEEPQVSAPPTKTRRQRKPVPDVVVPAPLSKRSNATEVNRGIVEAFFATRDGFPVDRVIADPELNEQFIATCARLGLPGKPFDWNHRLMNLRKAGHFKGFPRSRATTFPFEGKKFYRYKFACEIAIQRFEQDNEATLDYLLCDPSMASAFDNYVLTMLPDAPTSLMIRWSALRIRKSAHDISQASARLGDPIRPPRHADSPFALNFARVPAEPGLYWLRDNNRKLYVGETDNLRERLEIQFGHRKFDFWEASPDELQLQFTSTDAPMSDLPKHQSRWISMWHPFGNFEKLAAAS